MFGSGKKEQSSGDGSVNFQAEKITVQTGLSIAHVKEIALEVFENNFHKLSGVAKDTAEERARELTDNFLKEFSKRNPNGLEVAQDPGFQYDLYIAQKEFVRYGDQDLGEILVDILVDRTKHKEKDLRQLVLSEALVTAPKLTSGQIEILACHFNITLTKRNNFQSIKDFSKYISEVILPLSESVATAGVNYKHLEFVGCAAIRTGSWDLLEILRGAYPAIFCKGFSHEEFAKLREMDPNVTKVLIRCPHNPSLYQAGGMDDKINKQMCVSNGVSKEAETALLALNKNSMMSNVEAAEFIESVAPGFSKFVKGAKGSQFVNMELTSVGIAIAHAYSRKRLDFDADLSIWI